MIVVRIQWSEENDWHTVHSYEGIEAFESYEDLYDAIERWNDIGCVNISYDVLRDEEGE